MMIVKYRSARRGVVLVWALITMAVMTTVIGSMSAYYVSIGRFSHEYMSETARKFSGQYVIDSLMSSVKSKLDYALSSRETAMVGDFSSSKLDMDEVVEVLKGIDGKTESRDGYDVVLAVDGYKNLVDNLKASGEAKVVITANVTKGSGKGGVPVKVQQEITFKSDAKAALTTRPIYDYVYFVNNYGRLKSSRVFANGDVGSNAKFTLKGATVNGYVKSAEEVEIDNSLSPKIWPRNTYMAKVAVKYDGYFTQVRPTDPIIGSVDGVAYSEPWFGGYRPAVPINPYGFAEEPPSVVQDPGSSPTVPTKPEEATKPTYSYTPESYPDKNDAKYKHPTKESYYPKEPSYYDYGKKYDSTHDYSYPSEPTSKTSGKGKNQKTTWYYKPLGKTKQQTYSSKNAAYAAYNADKATQDAKCDAANKPKKDEYEQKCQESEKEWEAECARRDALYKADCDAVDARNKANKEKADKEYAEAQKAYDDAVASYQSRLDAYNSAVKRQEEWAAQKAAYEAYLKALADYQERYAKYIANCAEWDNQVGAGSQIERLTKSTYTEKAVDDYIIQERVSKLEWPKELSDVSECKKYCEDYRMIESNGVKSAGSLYCANMSEGRQISFVVAATNRTEYIASYGNLIGQEGDLLASVEGDKIIWTRTLNPINITGGSAGSITPFSDSQSGKSQNLSSIQSEEKGSVVLIGTSDRPIRINGPVFVPGDVVIRGFVTGRGTIYAGRNIHIIGDISYLNPPNWPHSRQDLTGSEAAKWTPDVVSVRNSDNDLLSLVAHGNIIVGDYTAANWTNSTQMSYLNLSGQQYLPVTDTDTSVGSKNRNYAAEDGGTTYGLECTHTDSGRKNARPPGKLVTWYHNVHTYTYSLKSRNRKFYESKFGTYVITGLKQTTAAAASAAWQKPTTVIKQVIADIVKFFGFDVNRTEAGINPSQVVNTDVGDITEIDAVLMANHGIFGVVGGTNCKHFSLNGAMICRDEGLLTSFEERFAGDSEAEIWLNWDMRIKSSSAEGFRSGALEENSPSTEVSLRVSDWRIVR